MQFDADDIQKVIVTYDPAETTVGAIVAAIESRGDTVSETIEYDASSPD